MTTHRPELDLLLTCARTPLQAGNMDAIRMQLSETLDWDAILRLARQHAVLPLLFHHIKTIGPQVLPQAAWDKLLSRFRANLSRNLFMTNQGYQPKFALTPSQERTYVRSSCEYSFKNTNTNIHLDIHWCIVRPHFMFSLDIDRLWDHLEPVQLGGHHIPSLRPEELLLILCVHGGKHEWERIGWIRDVAHLVHSRRDIQWEQLIEQATIQSGSSSVNLPLGSGSV